MICKYCGKELKEFKNGSTLHINSCKFAHENTNEILKLYLDDKLSIQSISKLLNINIKNISLILGDKKRKMITFYTDTNEIDIIKLRNDGLTYDEISQKLNCSKLSVSHFCKKHNLTNPNLVTKITSELINEMQLYYDIVLSSKKVAKKFKVSSSTVAKYIEIKERIVIDNELINKMQTCYNNLHNVNKVAKELNINSSTVLKYITIDEHHNLTETQIKERNVKSIIDRRIRIKERAVEYKGGKCCRCGYNKCISALCFHHINPSDKDFSISGRCLSWDIVQSELDKCIMVCMNCHQEIHAELKTNNQCQ